MDRSIQVVDQLGTDGALRQDELYCGQGIARISLQYAKECAVAFRFAQMIVFDGLRIGFS